MSKRSMRRNDRPKDDRQRPQPRSCWFARTLVLVLLRRCRSSYRVGVKIGMDRFVADLSPTDLSTPFTRVFGIRATGLPNDLEASRLLRQVQDDRKASYNRHLHARNTALLSGDFPSDEREA